MVNTPSSDQLAVFRRMCAAFLLLLLAAAGIAAQSSVAGSSTTSALTPTGMSPGSPAGTYPLSGFDNVNLFNGNLNVRLPLLTVGGRGSAGYTMMLATSSKKWQVRTDPGLDTNGFPITENSADKFTPLWKQWNTLEVGYSPGVMQGRKTGVGTVVKKTCDKCPIICNRRDPLYRYTLTRLTFIAPDGAEYELRDEATNGEPKPVEQARCNDLLTAGQNRGRRFVSTDGSAMTFVAAGNIFDDVRVHPGSTGAWFFNPNGVLYMRDGTSYRIDGGTVSWIRDRNGNQVSFVYSTAPDGIGSPFVTSITDSLGRRITVEYDLTEAPYGKHDRITYRGFGGAERVLRVSKAPLSSALRSPYTPKTRASLFPTLNALGFSGNFDPEVVMTVWLPDGRKYSIFYNSYGEVARVELPTGGATEYDMKDGSGVIVSSGATGSGIQERQIYRRLKESRVYTGLTADTLVSRTVYTAGDGTNEYNGTTVHADHVVTVEQLDGANQRLALSKHYFTGSAAGSLFTREVGSLYSPGGEGREVRTESLDTVNTNVVLRTVTNTWQQREALAWVGHLQTWGNNYPPPGLSIKPENDPRLTLVESKLETNEVTKQEFDYDRYNNQTEVREYGYGQGQPGALVRRTATAYLTTNPINGADYASAEAATPIHLRSLASDISIYDGAGIRRSHTVVEFDGYTPDAKHAGLVDRPGISGFDPAFTTTYITRGNPTATTSYFLNGDGNATGSISDYQQYDIAGNLVRSIDARGYATNISYTDCFGAPDGNATLHSAPIELSSAGKISYAFATAVTNPAGHTATAQFDYYIGRVVDGKDVNDVVASGFYDDALDRPTKVIRANGIDALQNQTTFTYDDTNRIITTRSDLNTFQDPAPLKGELVYDGLGRTTEVRQYESATGYIATLTHYDGLGRAFEMSNPYRPLANPAETPGWTTSEYDPLGRVRSVTTPDGAKVYTLYDGARMLVTDQAGKQRISRSDALGNLVEVWEVVASSSTDPEAVAVSFPVPQGGPVPGVAKGYKTSYQYDALTDLTVVTQGSQVRTFTYDSLKRLTSAKNPESDKVTYIYDDNGNLVSKTDGRNVIGTYVYDALNRVTSRSYSDGTPSVAYTYDAADVQNSKGQLTKVSSSVSSYSFGQYDALGRVKTGTQTTDGKNYLMSYEYNRAGDLISQTYPSGRIIKTEYDQAGRIAGVRNNGGPYYAGGASTDDTNRLQYSAAGAIQAMKLGNGLWEHTNFNSRLQATQIGLGSASTNSSILQLDYSYGTTNNNGNVQSQTITVPIVDGVPGFTATQTYTYDSLNRLATAQENSGGSWKQNFDYDRYGNRRLIAGTTLPASLEPANNPKINPNNNRIDDTAPGQTNVIYDKAGNLTREVGGHTYQYDAENKMVSYDGGTTSAGGESYSYDGDGRRVKRVVAGVSIVTTIFVYDISGKLIAEYSDSTPTGAGTSYVTIDTLASPRVITGSDKQVIGRHDYLPFGEELSAGTGGRNSQQKFGADNLRQKFTGYERDFETQLDYAQARYYSSKQGRFTGVDPLLASGRPNKPQSWNRYAYVLNNPLMLVDNTGLAERNPQKREDLHQQQKRQPLNPTKTADTQTKQPPQEKPRTADDMFNEYMSPSSVAPLPDIVQPTVMPNWKPKDAAKQKEYDACIKEEMAPTMEKLWTLMESNLQITTGAGTGGGFKDLGNRDAARDLRGGVGAFGRGASLATLVGLIKWRVELRNFDRDVFRPAQREARITCAGLAPTWGKVQ